VDDWEPYPPDLPQRFVERLRARGLEVESFDYPGTEHSFCNPAAAQYDAEAATRVFDRAVGFVRARNR
jgi:dienelactone hydrolase